MIWVGGESTCLFAHLNLITIIRVFLFKAQFQLNSLPPHPTPQKPHFTTHFVSLYF